MQTTWRLGLRAHFTFLAVATPTFWHSERPKSPSRPVRCDGVEARVADERRCLMPKDGLQAAPDCPAMVVLPRETFDGIADGWGGRPIDNEGPQRKVTMAKPFAVANSR